jgi:uncharacterized protein (TIGR02118 family)
MLKLSVLYGHPKNAEDFEKYYKEKHLPLAYNMKGLEKMELTKVLGTPDGQQAEFYRCADLYFKDLEQMQETMASEEGQATVTDLSNFATGGVTVMIGTVE